MEANMPTHSTPVKMVNFRKFRENLSDYLRQAQQGNKFVVTSRNVELARIGPPADVAQKRKQLIGMFKGTFQMAPDFNETPADLIAVLEGDEE
jgi:prevent-host-death family protein